jgi:hypothetical protein
MMRATLKDNSRDPCAYTLHLLYAMNDEALSATKKDNGCPYDELGGGFR